MQFSESWLRQYVDPALDTEALAHLLTMGGLEVEETAPVAPPFDRIVVGHVLEVAKHPNADRLSVCQVDAGTGTTLTIVCGAPNVRAGIKVPCALEGARLPPAEAGGDPFVIRAATMRGVASQGMLCSARELKLSEDHSGLLILPDGAPTGAPVREVLDLDDTVFTLKLTPNRADCLSVYGVAREVSALSGAPLKPIDIKPAPVSLTERLPVTIAAPDLCGRFSGRIIRGVNAKAPTPDWMKQRLERSGQRSISALVDISNYIMLELGRPTHVFDLDKIEGGLEVRWGRQGERLELLNGQTIDLDEWVGVIADQTGVESLAGIMGGEETAVTLETTSIYVEAAFWWPESIQGRARKYNFSTDASHRFERGVDWATTVEHIERITGLILEVCGGKAGPIDDQSPNVPERRPVSMRVARATRIIGVPIGKAEIAHIFARLQFETRDEGDRFTVTPPSYRFDITIEEDLIEEVARCHGFENIPEHAPIVPAIMLATPETHRSWHSIRDSLAALDYQEVMNFSFTERQWEEDLAGNSDPIPVVNPIASQLAVMRSTLLGGLVANARYNLNRKATRVRVFEVAKVFRRDDALSDGPLTVAGIAQPVMVAGLALGPAHAEQWGEATRPVDFFDVKGDVERLFVGRTLRFEPGSHPAFHPGRSARVLVDGNPVGWIGEVHPRWLQKYDLTQPPVAFEIEGEALQHRPLPAVAEIPRFPAVLRDRAFFFDVRIPVQHVLDAIDAVRKKDTPAGLIRDVVLFDDYRGKGLKNNEKSLAFRFLLQDTHQTLSDETVDAALEEVSAELRDRFGAVPRI